MSTAIVEAVESVDKAEVNATHAMVVEIDVREADKAVKSVAVNSPAARSPTINSGRTSRKEMISR